MLNNLDFRRLEMPSRLLLRATPPGEAVRIVMPCWRLHGEVVVRGEAEPLPESLRPSAVP